MQGFELIAKWNGCEYVLRPAIDATVYDLKCQLEALTNVRVKRQKLVGLTPGKLLPDETPLSICKLKHKQKVILMGTPEAALTAFETTKEYCEVFDDFDMAMVPSEEEIQQNLNNRAKLKQVIEQANIHVIHPPRPHKKLLVLDLDYTILDCKDISERDSLHDYKRPYLEDFMISCYQDFDIVVWSQTSWRWVEIKLTEMGLLTNPKFNISFVLDQTFMFSISSKDGKKQHQVKALEIIWAKFPHWNRRNTLHVDDLTRNFAMNPKNGLKISPFKNALSSRATDIALHTLTNYLRGLSNKEDVSAIDHTDWEKQPQ